MSPPKTVLIVDDSAALVDWLGAAAVVFLDVDTPSLDGASLCRVLEGRPYWKKTASRTERPTP